MKIFFVSYTDAHYQATVVGGLKGGALGLGLGSAGAFAMNARYPGFRALTLPIKVSYWHIKTKYKAFFVTSASVAALIIEADRASRAFEAKQYGLNIHNVVHKDANLTSVQRSLHWARENRWKILGGSWAASMAGSWYIVNRDKYMTGSQKLVQARVYAQGITIAMILLSAIFFSRDYAEEEKGEDEEIDDPSHPGKKLLVHHKKHERYPGEYKWETMVNVDCV